MQFFIDSGFIVAVSLLFLLVLILVYFGSKRLEKFFHSAKYQQEKESEGAPRAACHVFYVLIAWACLNFLLPMTLSFQEQISSLNPTDIGFRPVLQIIFGPLIFLLIIFYGVKRNFLDWIRNIDWPDEEDT